MQTHQSTLNPLIKQACDMVHRDQFNQSLTQLNLLNISSQSEGAEPAGAMPKSSQTITKYAQVRQGDVQFMGGVDELSTCKLSWIISKTCIFG